MRAARIDANQAAICAALRQVGAKVQSLASVGNGVPDLLVRFRGVNYLLEVKDGAKSPSKQALTPDQKVWHAEWDGAVKIVNSIEAALTAIGATK